MSTFRTSKVILLLAGAVAVFGFGQLLVNSKPAKEKDFIVIATEPKLGAVYLLTDGAKVPLVSRSTKETLACAMGYEIFPGEVELIGGNQSSHTYKGKSDYNLFAISTEVLTAIQKELQIFVVRENHGFRVLSPLEAVTLLNPPSAVK